MIQAQLGQVQAAFRWPDTDEPVQERMELLPQTAKQADGAGREETSPRLSLSHYSLAAAAYQRLARLHLKGGDQQGARDRARQLWGSANIPMEAYGDSPSVDRAPEH